MVPERLAEDGTASTQRVDHLAAGEVEAMLVSLGYAEGGSWIELRTAAALTEEDRRQHLVVLCGSNPTAHEIFQKHGEIFRTVYYSHGDDRSERYFCAYGSAFKWTPRRDYALVAIKANPYNNKKRLVLLVGLRATGTWGAATAYSSETYSALRAAIRRDFEQGNSDLEVLLAVDHNQERDTLTNISIAKSQDGEPVIGPPRLRPIRLSEAVLDRLYETQNEHPRPIKILNQVYELTYEADFSITIKEDLEIQPGDHDIVLFGRQYQCDVDYPAMQADAFTADCRSGGDVYVLQATNELQLKRFLLFPAPSMDRETDPRIFECRMHWPEAGRKLRTVNSIDRANLRIQSSDKVIGTVGKVVMRIRFEMPGVRVTVTPNFKDPKPEGNEPVFTEGTSFERVWTSVAPGSEFRVTITRVR